MPKKDVKKAKPEKASAKRSAKFGCPYCLESFSSFEAIKSHIIKNHRAESLPEPEGTIRVTINGQDAGTVSLPGTGGARRLRVPLSSAASPAR